MNRKIQIPLLISLAAISQAQTRQDTSAGNGPAQRTGVDGVIALVNAGISEQIVMKRLQQEGQAYALTTDDLLKLKKGSVPEKIIEMMMDPRAQAAAAPAPAPPAPSAAQAPAVAGSPEAKKDPEPKKEEKKGMFRRFGRNLSDRAKKTGQNTLDSTQRTADNTLDSAEKKANQKVEGAQQKADGTVQSSLGHETDASTVDKGTGAAKQGASQKNAPAKR